MEIQALWVPAWNLSSLHTGPLRTCFSPHWPTPVSWRVPQKPLGGILQAPLPRQVRQAFGLVGEFQVTVVHRARHLM